MNGRTMRIRCRQAANLLNLATPLGLLLARTGRARLARGPHDVIVAHGYRSRFPAPHAGAVTVGDVVLLRLTAEDLARLPGLLEHEARHSVQWACFLGPVGFLPAYLLGCAWSWWHSGNFAVRNPFEMRAGLVDGGYARQSSRPPNPPHS